MKETFKVTTSPEHESIKQWFTNFNHSYEGDYRVICFPFSGGGANVFREWPSQLPQAECWALKLPGREARFSAPLISNLEQLVETLAPLVHALMDKPCVFFGHSMGALIAFELARYIEIHYQKSIELLIVSAYRSPERKSKKRQLHTLSDHEFVRELMAYGGTTSQILVHKETMQLLLPMLRSDFKLHETHHFNPSPSLSSPIHAFYGREDEFATQEEVQGWSKYTTKEFKLSAFDGDHFFLNTEYKGLCDVIKRQVNHTSGSVELSSWL